MKFGKEKTSATFGFCRSRERGGMRKKPVIKQDQKKGNKTQQFSQDQQAAAL
jgi:hypothetical protein